MVCLSPLSVSYQAIQCLISLRVLRSRETSLLPLRLILDFSYFAVEEEQVRGWLSSKCIPVSNLRWIKRIIHTNMQSTYKSSFCGNWNYGRIHGKALPGVHRLMPWDQLSSLGYSVTALVTCIAVSGSSVITLMSVTAFSLNTVAQLQGWGRDFPLHQMTRVLMSFIHLSCPLVFLLSVFQMLLSVLNCCPSLLKMVSTPHSCVSSIFYFF